MRAKEADYHTVSLPGAAVWHVSWIDKDDLVGWQAYFHIRNRIIAALLGLPEAQALAPVLGGSSALASDVLTRAGVDPTLRGEQLTIDDFVAVASAHLASLEG